MAARTSTSLAPRSGRSVLRARLAVPVCSRPLENAAVLIRGSRIESVLAWNKVPTELKREAVDLGDVILLPGLVNAHCHLDYTDMAGQFPPPKVFTEWLKLITEAKSGWSLADFAASWSSGARMLIQTGTTFVGDIEAVPALLPEVWNRTPLRMLSFLEMIGITNRRTPSAILGEALEAANRLRGVRGAVGLSPHAPYSTLPDLLRLCSSTARQRRLRLCIHVAESRLELDMFRDATGSMFEWLRRSGREMSDCGLGSPLRHLERCGLLGENLLATHVNYLCRGDAALLARRGTHVVHCPRSHAYFQHDAFPLRTLRRAGVNICLGTDSLASVYRARRETVELSLFDEMRALKKAHSWLSAEEILKMATVNGATALGISGKAGQLSRGAHADATAIPFSGKKGEVWDALLAHRGHVSATMIDGVWAVPPLSLNASPHALASHPAVHVSHGATTEVETAA